MLHWVTGSRIPDYIKGSRVPFRFEAPCIRDAPPRPRDWNPTNAAVGEKHSNPCSTCKKYVKSMWKFGQGFPVSVWPTVCQVTRISLIFQKQPLHPAAPWQRGNYSRTDLERRATDFLYIMFILCSLFLFILCSFMFIHIHSYSTYSIIFHRDHFLCTLDMQEDQ